MYGDKRKYKTRSASSLPSEFGMDRVIQGDARALSGQLQALREELLPPEAKRDLATRFSSSEAACLDRR